MVARADSLKSGATFHTNAYLSFQMLLNCRLVVSQEFHLDWHEHMYTELKAHVITSDKLMEEVGYILADQMKVC